jgi:hypothetical protein
MDPRHWPICNFRIVLTGRLKAPDRIVAEQMLKAGMSFTLPIHEAIDGLLIDVVPEESIADMATRFKP